jgi:hypothetical protein
VRALVSSLQAEPVRPGGDDGRTHHRGVKQRIATMLGFKGFATAAITIAGIELMHRIRKGQFGLGRLGVQGRLAPAVWNAVLQA